MLSQVNAEPGSTRERLLDAAESCFAEKGFYGSSLRDIATLVGISKPSLIHHFPNKESLYSEVLARIAEGLMARWTEAEQADGDERQKLHSFIDGFCDWSSSHENEARILMRELLDNPRRLSDVHHWHLKALMDNLADLMKSGQQKGLFRNIDPLPVIINLLGGQHYLMIVRPTLEQIYGKVSTRRLDRDQADLLKRMVDAELLH